MEERIRKFIEFKGISPSELADEIGVQRSNVTHVLKARNKPSFQFIEKLLQAYPELNAKWLLLGTGNMTESAMKTPRTLFDAVPEPVPAGNPTVTTGKPDENSVGKELEKQETVHAPKDDFAHQGADKEQERITDSEPVSPNDLFDPEKPIERLIVFFKDQTFKVYYPSR
jgi:transcriptional regulator with XRE-family HTH domain